MRTAIWIVVLAIVVSYVGYALLTVEHGTDEAQIGALVARGVAATENRDLSGVISCVSSDYKDEAGLNYDRLRIILAQALRNERDYTVSISGRKIQIDGDRATVLIHVRLRHTGGATFYTRDLTLRLAKEKSSHMFIVPTKVWRVVGSENSGLADVTQ